MTETTTTLTYLVDHNTYDLQRRLPTGWRVVTAPSNRIAPSRSQACMSGYEAYVQVEQGRHRDAARLAGPPIGTIIRISADPWPWHWGHRMTPEYCDQPRDMIVADVVPAARMSIHDITPTSVVDWVVIARPCD